MKKGIILIGKANTGKSRLAKLLMAGKKVVSLNGRSNDLFKSHFTFMTCENDTEAIHFEDLLNYNEHLPRLFNFITDGIVVDKKHQKPFTIFPQIIVTINTSIANLEISKSLEHRFDIFELSACNQNYYPLNK